MIESDAPWQAWSPQVGERVRVRISTECRWHRDVWRDGIAPEEAERIIAAVNGQIGTVHSHDVVNSYPGENDPPDTHPIAVLLDEFVAVDGMDGVWAGGWFAAAELEPEGWAS